MRVFHTCKKLRYLLNPHYNYSTSISPLSILIRHATFSNSYFLFPHDFYSIPSKSAYSSSFSNGSISIPQISQLWSYKLSFPLYSSSWVDSYAKTCRNFGENQVSNGDINIVIDIIRGDGSDMESKLDLVGSHLPNFMLEILHCLNLLRISALHFFTWFKNEHPSYCKNSDICNLVVANCGLLGDYDAMLNLLIDFRNHQICLNEKAFRFLPIPSSKKSVDEVIRVLNRVGGSCRNSGIHSLVHMFCSISSFNLAKYVIEITEKKVSYYRIMVKHLCVSGQFEDAGNLFEEMRRVKCEPDSKTYNYLISSLCKQRCIDDAFAVVQDMLSRGCSPNLITFEILIYFACMYGHGTPTLFYDKMASSGVKPRLSTHYAFIRGYFRSQQFAEAYEYVISFAVLDKCAAHDLYNVLAGLHVREGDFLVAHDILLEMLVKGLKPRYSIFRRVIRCLCNNGKQHLAKNLKAKAWYYSQDNVFNGIIKSDISSSQRLSYSLRRL